MPSPPFVIDSLSFEPLTPTAYLDRAAAAHGDRVAVVDGDRRWTYARAARALHAGSPGGWPRSPAGGRWRCWRRTRTCCWRRNFGVPWAGVPLVAVNTRLSAGEVAYILEHSEAAVLVHDPVFDELVDAALAQLDAPPHRIRAGEQYEELLASGGAAAPRPTDERSLLSINYTSGTTGRPKGVMYHHRGRLPAGAGDGRAHRAHPVVGAPVDAADVPLQRLVLPVGGHRGRRRRTSACRRWTRPRSGG